MVVAAERDAAGRVERSALVERGATGRQQVASGWASKAVVEDRRALVAVALQDRHRKRRWSERCSRCRGGPCAGTRPPAGPAGGRSCNAPRASRQAPSRAACGQWRPAPARPRTGRVASGKGVGSSGPLAIARRRSRIAGPSGFSAGPFSLLAPLPEAVTSSDAVDATASHSWAAANTASRAAASLSRAATADGSRSLNKSSLRTARWLTQPALPVRPAAGRPRPGCGDRTMSKSATQELEELRAQAAKEGAADYPPEDRGGRDSRRAPGSTWPCSDTARRSATRATGRYSGLLMTPHVT